MRTLMIPSEKCPARVTKDELVAKDLRNEYLLYDHKGDRMHVLNATARAIYLLCDGTRRMEDLVREFGDLYSLDDSTARDDADRAVEDLIELGLVSLS